LPRPAISGRGTLSSPAAGDSDLLGRRLQEALDDAAPLLQRRSGPTHGRPAPGRLGLLLVAGLGLLAMA